MKSILNTLLGLTLLTSITAGAQESDVAYAGDNVPAYIHATLQNLDLHPDSHLAQREYHGGTIAIDMAQEQITLALLPVRNNCPPNAFCITVMPAPVTVTLPLEDIREGECGETIYEGVRDARPADGLLEVLTVVDNSTSTCVDTRIRPATEIEYTVTTPGHGAPVQTLASYFTADVLKRTSLPVTSTKRTWALQ